MKTFYQYQFFENGKESQKIITVLPPVIVFGIWNIAELIFTRIDHAEIKYIGCIKQLNKK